MIEFVGYFILWCGLMITGIWTIIFLICRLFTVPFHGKFVLAGAVKACKDMKWKNKKDKKLTEDESTEIPEGQFSEWPRKTQSLIRDEEENKETDWSFRNRIPHSWEGSDEGNSGNSHPKPPEEGGSNYNPFEDESNGEPMFPII